MAPKKNPVNDISEEISNYGTIGGRLISERKLHGLSQIDLRLQTGVSKTTQFRYESGENFPDAQYLVQLHELGFDVLYILTGARSAGTLKPAHQNLIDAYEDAPETLKIAVFGMLLTAYYPFRRHIDDAMKIPGFNRYELADEEDVRYEAYREEERKKDEPKGDVAIPSEKSGKK